MNLSRDLRSSMPLLGSGSSLNIRRWLLTGTPAASGPHGALGTSSTPRPAQ